MKQIIIQIISIAVIILLIFLLIGQFGKQNRINENFRQSTLNTMTKFFVLSKSEFKDYKNDLTDTLYEMIKDSVNIKDKHVTSTIYHHYYNVFDSTFTSLITHENSKYLYFEKDLDKCLSIKGRVSDTVIYFDEVTIDYEARTVYYWQRKHKIIGIPFGKKQYFGITLNNCTGQTEVNEIKIGKR